MDKINSENVSKVNTLTCIFYGPTMSLTALLRHCKTLLLKQQTISTNIYTSKLLLSYTCHINTLFFHLSSLLWWLCIWQAWGTFVQSLVSWPFTSDSVLQVHHFCGTQIHRHSKLQWKLPHRECGHSARSQVSTSLAEGIGKALPHKKWQYLPHCI